MMGTDRVLTVNDLHALDRALYAAQRNAPVTWMEHGDETPTVGFARRICGANGEVVPRDVDVRDMFLEMIVDGRETRFSLDWFVHLFHQNRLFVMEATS